MQKFDVQIALEAVAEARSTWGKAMSKFNADVEYVMKRLLNEAAVNYMSVEHVAQASGLTTKRVRMMMRNHGLNPKSGKRLLAKQASATLADNAALLGIEPHEMDLMSPLAYLPMGSDMKKFLETEAQQGVKELPDEPCGARHPRMTVVSPCLLRGSHDQHRGVCGDEHGSVVLWGGAGSVMVGEPRAVDLDALVDVYRIAWHAADARGESGVRTEAGVMAVLGVLGYAVAVSSDDAL